MADNLRAHVYRTSLEFDASGLDDTYAIDVATAVSTVWNPAGKPDDVYDDVLAKLETSFSVPSKITHRPTYRLVPDGMGGYKRVRTTAKTINVDAGGKDVTVDLSWDDDQGPA